jgi:hypothetical protein
VRTDIGSATNYWEAFGSTSFPILRSTHTSGAIQISSGSLFVQTDTSGATQLTVAHTASAVNYIQVSGSVTSSAPYLLANGSDTNVPLVISSKGSSSILFKTAGTTPTQMEVSHTASAVNYVQVTGSITGSPVAISAQGSDSNIRMNLFSKGTESIDILTNGGAVRQARFTNTASTVNWVQMTGSATGFGAVIRAAGSDTNIPLVVQPQGTGALQAQLTDSTATGGNARGANAVDWSTARATATQVASGQWSTISGGVSNTVSATASNIGGGATNAVSNTYSGIFGGQNNTNTATYSFIGGGSSNTTGTNAYQNIVGGKSNTASGVFNFVGGGFTNSGTSSSAVTTQSGTMNATTAVTLSGSNANIKVGQYISGTSIGDDTYVAAISGTSLTLSKVASGSSTSTLSFFTPHGIVVGGGNNTATGSYSFIGGGGDAGTAGNRNVASGDWSVVGGGRKNTASGSGSTVAGGGTSGTDTFGNTASGALSTIGGGWNSTASGTLSVVAGGQSQVATGNNSSILGGSDNTASGAYSSVLGGLLGTTRGIVGNAVIPAASLPIASNAGVNQCAILILARQTTDATPTILRSDSSAAGSTNQVIMPNNSAYFFTGEVVAGVTGGGNTKGWTIEGVIKRGANAASTALVGTPTVTSTYADAGASTWVIAVTADTTNGGLAVTFTGQASTTIRTVAKISTVEMTY